MASQLFGQPALLSTVPPAAPPPTPSSAAVSAPPPPAQVTANTFQFAIIGKPPTLMSRITEQDPTAAAAYRSPSPEDLRIWTPNAQAISSSGNSLLARLQPLPLQNRTSPSGSPMKGGTHVHASTASKPIPAASATASAVAATTVPMSTSVSTAQEDPRPASRGSSAEVQDALDSEVPSAQLEYPDTTPAPMSIDVPPQPSMPGVPRPPSSIASTPRPEPHPEPSQAAVTPTPALVPAPANPPPTLADIHALTSALTQTADAHHTARTHAAAALAATTALSVQMRSVEDAVRTLQAAVAGAEYDARRAAEHADGADQSVGEVLQRAGAVVKWVEGEVVRRERAAEEARRAEMEARRRAHKEEAARRARAQEEVAERERARRAEEATRRRLELERRASEERKLAEAQARVKREAEEALRRQQEEVARVEAEDARREEEARLEAARLKEEVDRQKAEEAARQEALDRVRHEAEEQARKEAEDHARQAAEDLARKEAEMARAAEYDRQRREVAARKQREIEAEAVRLRQLKRPTPDSADKDKTPDNAKDQGQDASPVKKKSEDRDAKLVDLASAGNSEDTRMNDASDDAASSVDVPLASQGQERDEQSELPAYSVSSGGSSPIELGPAQPQGAVHAVHLRHIAASQRERTASAPSTPGRSFRATQQLQHIPDTSPGKVPGIVKNAPATPGLPPIAVKREEDDSPTGLSAHEAEDETDQLLSSPATTRVPGKLPPPPRLKNRVMLGINPQEKQAKDTNANAGGKEQAQGKTAPDNARRPSVGQGQAQNQNQTPMQNVDQPRNRTRSRRRSQGQTQDGPLAQSRIQDQSPQRAHPVHERPPHTPPPQHGYQPEPDVFARYSPIASNTSAVHLKQPYPQASKSKVFTESGHTEDISPASLSASGSARGDGGWDAVKRRRTHSPNSARRRPPPPVYDHYSPSPAPGMHPHPPPIRRESDHYSPAPTGGVYFRRSPSPVGRKRPRVEYESDYDYVPRFRPASPPRGWAPRVPSPRPRTPPLLEARRPHSPPYDGYGRAASQYHEYRERELLTMAPLSARIEDPYALAARVEADGGPGLGVPLAQRFSDERRPSYGKTWNNKGADDYGSNVGQNQNHNSARRASNNQQHPRGARGGQRGRGGSYNGAEQTQNRSRNPSGNSLLGRMEGSSLQDRLGG